MVAKGEATRMTELFKSDTTLLKNYNEYQARYSTTIRESDKILLSLIAQQSNRGTLLDIGCSTGNFLSHVRAAFPETKLTGGDIAESSLAICRANPNLAGVDIRRMDITNVEGSYDIVVSNAVTSVVNDDIFERGMKSIARGLKPGGVFITFEWMSQFDGQSIEIREKTRDYPDGFWLYFRSYAHVRSALTAAGLADIEYMPFEIQIDLPFPGFDSVQTYTIKDEHGKRMNFRGVLFQPWAFVTAKKPLN
jgi:SAM-dependent methyltransferase